MRRIFLLIAVLFFAAGARAQSLTGVVVDSEGAAVTAAVVTVNDGGAERARAITDSDGRFVISAAVTLRSRLVCRADGFSPFERSLKNDGVRDFTIVLQPLPVGAEVTVSVTRTESRLSETPASIVVLDRATLDNTAAQTVDDALRQVAGFTLFRRGSSRTTNPTAQGANLRGVSGSGASRAAVMFDGLSLNDAFGGWTYWSRVPLVAVEQAEVLRGGASSLYGSGGLSGAVDLVPPKPEADGPLLNLRASAGSQATLDGSFYTAYAPGHWGFDLAAETYQTGGYIPIAENERGRADTRSNSRHNNGVFAIEGRFPAARTASAGGYDGRIFVRGNFFEEHRDNGTSLTYNQTYFREAAGGADLTGGRFGDLRFRAFLETQVYDQSFSAVSIDRNSETLSRLQRVPSQAAGANLFWTRPIRSHTLAVSVETREVRGFSDEVGYANGRAVSLSGSGGRQRTIAAFVQDNWAAAEKLNVSLGARIDRWRNLDAHSDARTLATNAFSESRFADRTEAAVSPRLAAIYQAVPSVAVYGSYSRSFRAPTLNELYRGFRVGSVVTQPNENLRAETADTFESGVNLSAVHRRINLRGNAFVTTVSDPVVSVTLATTPTLITRQRQNVGETRTRGIELDAEFTVRSDLRLSASYLFADSRVSEFPSSPVLVGRFLPQIARQQLNFQINYRPASSFSFGIQSRISGGQWEDDLNTLRLRPYFMMDGTAAYRIGKRIEVFAAAENIFNSRYDIGLTPVLTVASPVFARAGLRLWLGGK